MDYEIKQIGNHRGNARLWFETRALEKVGLVKGAKFRVVQRKEGGFYIERVDDADGERTVSGKQKGNHTVPIIDICNSTTLGDLANEPAVKVEYDVKKQRVIVTKLSSAEKAANRTGRLAKVLSNAALTVAALCFGGGVMDHSAHAGMLEAGVKSELVAAIEIDTDLLEHAAKHNPVITANTKLYAAPMQELVQDHEAMSQLPEVDIMVTGIPCSGASISGKSKLGLESAEDHPEVGHLVVPYLMLVNKFNPSVAVVECVVPYSQTVSAKLMRSMFRDMGYDVHETVLDAYDFGSIEARKRWFLVAVSHGIPMDLSNLAPTILRRPKLGDYLQPMPKEAYNPMEGLVAKQERDIADKKGFRMQVCDADTVRIGVIGKDYMKNRSTEPKVAYPGDPKLLRLLTSYEHALIKGFPPTCLAGLSNTAAHQLLGQSVDTRPVKALFKRIAENLKAWKGSSASRVAYSLGRKTG